MLTWQLQLTDRNHWWSGREVLVLWQRWPAVGGILCWTGWAIAWSAGSVWRRAGSCARRPSGTRRPRHRCGSHRGYSVPTSDRATSSRRQGTQSLPENVASCRNLRCPVQTTCPCLKVIMLTATAKCANYYKVRHSWTSSLAGCCPAVMLILVLKDSLRTKFKSLSLSLQV